MAYRQKRGTSFCLLSGNLTTSGGATQMPEINGLEHDFPVTGGGSVFLDAIAHL